jgi:hypothetical protein
MTKRAWFLVGAVALAFGGGSQLAGAHECTYDGEGRNTGNQVECHETPVAPNWRDGNYVPLFDLDDRNDPRQRANSQRWREECQGYDDQGNYHSDQMCAWARGGYSHTPGQGGEISPNEVHTGFAASHCFLGEFAHQCQGHDKRFGEGVHDGHGGAIYADVCLTANPESKYCRNGPSDTQAGLTIMDHNPCGFIVPIVACIDEYHVVRPLDPAFTQRQMEDSLEYIPRILSDPELYLCGYRNRRGAPPILDQICPGGQPAGGASGAQGASIHRSETGTRDAASASADVANRTRTGHDGVTVASSSRTGSVPATGGWLLLVTCALGLRVRRVFAMR